MRHWVRYWIGGQPTIWAKRSASAEREAAASRSALAERFAQIVGCPPIQYLTQWRMQIAAKRLADPAVKIATVAHEVGYESEAAFSRAFKKFVGRSPGQ